MLIDLKTIPQGSIKHFDFHLDRNWWIPDENNNQISGIEKPLNVRIDMYRSGNRYVLEGGLEGVLQVYCDRCLTPYAKELSFDFNVYLAPPPKDIDKAEIELLEEDMEVVFIRDEEIDLDEIIREQIYLALPIKNICDNNCLGLCPKCGCNLNREKCGCEQEKGHPGLLVLKKLKL
jgi:uncharacterized protein